MTWTSVIRKGFVRRRRQICNPDKVGSRSNFPFVKTGEPGQLDSEHDNESEQQHFL